MRWCGGPCDLLRRKIFVLLVLIGCSDGYFNIFISHSQVMKLLGLEAELYYVREGVVNTYAMNFVVPVPANIADLEFSWQSLVGHPMQEEGGGRAIVKIVASVLLALSDHLIYSEKVR
ncbi:tyrosine-protein kinase Drl [Mycetomoellerius zeteki]|uniref:tyrosine-protein kinase Drl n=1 Tax=Mycetomoellerius zeteki TaxID=64791 RepID=UPI00084E50CB|nr:PREDICTED: tyrosine-protein kinase Drl-like [Trachymyrmex zeteki]